MAGLSFPQIFYSDAVIYLSALAVGAYYDATKKHTLSLILYSNFVEARTALSLNLSIILTIVVKRILTYYFLGI